jgi:predicted nuclease with TOPRIM domain
MREISKLKIMHEREILEREEFVEWASSQEELMPPEVAKLAWLAWQHQQNKIDDIQSKLKTAERNKNEYYKRLMERKEKVDTLTETVKRIIKDNGKLLEKIDELEADNKKMLEALVEGIKRNELNGKPCEQMYLTVEKVTDKTWEEIKAGKE